MEHSPSKTPSLLFTERLPLPTPTSPMAFSYNELHLGLLSTSTPLLDQATPMVVSTTVFLPLLGTWWSCSRRLAPKFLTFHSLCSGDIIIEGPKCNVEESTRWVETFMWPTSKLHCLGCSTISSSMAGPWDVTYTRYGSTVATIPPPKKTARSTQPFWHNLPENKTIFYMPTDLQDRLKVT